MEYKFSYHKRAEKYLDALPQISKTRIMDAIEALPIGNVCKLQSRSGYRLVVGGFRVLFDYTGKFDENGKEIIDIQKIGSRGDVYK